MSQEDCNDWYQRLPDLIEGYEEQDIFNLDETGLFYRGLPDKTLNVKGTDCTGGKKSKERITVSLIANAAGDIEKLLVIGKSAKPRCFRNLQTTTRRHG